MTITRKSLAATIDEYDEQIADLNEGKKETFQSYRAQLAAQGMDKEAIAKEVEAFKIALRKRRKIKEDPKAVEDKDDLVDEILDEISAKPRATRDARSNERANSVRDSDAAAPPKGTSESLSLPAGGGKPEEAGKNTEVPEPLTVENRARGDDAMPLGAGIRIDGSADGTARTEAAAVTDRRDGQLNSNSDGNNLPGGPAASSAPTESASDEISASNTPEGRSGTARKAPSAGSGDDALQASSGIQSAAPFHSNAAPPPPVENAAHLPEAEQASGLSSNRGQTNPVVPAKAEEAVPSTPQSQASSAATHTQPVRTKSGKGDRLPVPPPRHVPDLPSFLDRRKMNLPPKGSTENINGNIRETERAR